MIVAIDGLAFSGSAAVFRMAARASAPNPFVYGTLKWFTHQLLSYYRLTAAAAPDADVFCDAHPAFLLQLAAFLRANKWLRGEDEATFRQLYAQLEPRPPDIGILVRSETHHILNRIVSYNHGYNGRTPIPAFYYSAQALDKLVAFVDGARGAFTHTLSATAYFEFNLPESAAIRSQLRTIIAHNARAGNRD